MTTSVQSPAAGSALAAILQGSQTSSTTGASGSTSATTSANDAQDRFLKLLVTQMQNQDPMNPMDNSQMTSQLAQISTVTGIDTLNSTVQTLMTNLGTSQSIQAANLVGKSVLVPGKTVATDGTSGGTFGVDLPQAVDTLQVKIMDASGNAIRTLNLGSQSSGANTYAWDGKADSGAAAAPGNYTFSVTATQGGNSVAGTALSVAQVTSVSTGTQGVKLNLGNLGTASMSDVRQIL